MDVDGHEQQGETSQPAAQDLESLRHKIQANPYDYQAHVAFIDALRSNGDKGMLAHARQRMSETFPITEELWVDWIKDESGHQPRDHVTRLFERAVTDYLSVPLWLMYCRYAMAEVDPEADPDPRVVARVRDVFEAALRAAGLHVQQGAEIFRLYQSFEEHLLDELLEEEDGMDANESGDVKEQADRIIKLFRRQLSVPLAGNDETLSEMEEWCQENGREKDLAGLKAVHATTSKQYAALAPLEARLAAGGDAAVYHDYVEHERSHGDDPARIAAVYERAVAAHPLDGSLWAAYLQYIADKMKTSDIVLPLHRRAVRNCPWVAALWASYMRAMERCGKPHHEIEAVLQEALSTGFTSGDDYYQLWLAYIAYQRRRVNWSQSAAEIGAQMAELRETMQKAIDYINTYFQGAADPTCSIQQHWARLELWYCDNIDGARAVWEGVVKTRGKQAPDLWLAYIGMQQQLKDAPRIRSLFKRACQNLNELAEPVCAAWLQYEREFGDLDSEDAALQWVTAHRQRQAARLAQLAAKERALAEPTTTDKSKARKRTASEGDEGGAAEKKARGEGAAGGEVPHHKDDHTKDHVTIFVSNLPYTAGEDELRQMFSQLGDITEIRIVRNARGTSKGFAYVEFTTDAPVAAAVAMDRQHQLQGRPVFISSCVRKEKAEWKAKGFKYDPSRDPKTICVRNLPLSYTKDQINELFAKCGEVKETRPVMKRNGTFRGYAYVEYKDEAGAQAALAKNGQTVDGNTLLVAISDSAAQAAAQQPKQHAGAMDFRPPTSYKPAHSTKPGRFNPKPGHASAPKATPMSLVPRMVKRTPGQPGAHLSKHPKPRLDAPAHPHPTNAPGEMVTDAPEPEAGSQTKMSNKDFKAMLLAGKKE